MDTSSLSVHDQKALEAAQNLKLDLIKSLTTTAELLRRDVEERQKWLEAPTAITPKVTRRLTQRQISSALTVETRLVNSKRPKTLTLTTKKLIQALEVEAIDRMHQVEDQMRSDYQADLEEDPMYIGLSPQKLEKVETEFQTRLAKQLKAIENELAQQVESVIRNQPTVRVSKTSDSKTAVVTTKEDAKLNKLIAQELAKREELMTEIQATEQEERQAFEECLPEYVAQGWSAKTVANSKRDLDDQLAKDRARKLDGFTRTTNMKVRLLKAEVLAQELEKTNGFNNTELLELLSIYKAELSKTVLMDKPRFTWEEVILRIDEMFEVNGQDWQRFVEEAVKIWSNAATTSTTGLLSIRMRLYAYLYLSIHKSDSTEAEADTDYQVVKLQRERDQLVKDAIALDAHIAKKLAQLKAQALEVKKKSLRASTVVAKPKSGETFLPTSNISKESPESIEDRNRELEIQQALEVEMVFEAQKQKRRLKRDLVDQKEVDSFYDSYAKSKRK